MTRDMTLHHTVTPLLLTLKRHSFGTSRPMQADKTGMVTVQRLKDILNVSATSSAGWK